jgi:dTDP-4-amino-4,6-dideoxygalactose transaminase
MNNRPALLGDKPIFDHKIDFVRPVLPEFAEVSVQLRELFESGMLTKGKHLRAFEASVAEYLQVKYAVAVSSCTSGLILVYQALGLTGEVIVPSFTFMATVGALVWAGVHPIFADVNPSTMNLDPSMVEAAITPETSAIAAVHNFGNPAQIDDLQTLADRHGLKLIFDAAQGFGSLFHGVPIGGQGDAQVYSLTPSKLLIAGEGGIVATNDEQLAESIRVGREYGNAGNYDSAFVGLNARLPEFNALMGRHSLLQLEASVQERNRIAESYRARLGSLPGLTFQEVLPGNQSSYTYFSVIIEPDLFGLTRDELALALTVENIETRKYYDPPVHRQTAYRPYTKPLADLVSTNFLAARVLTLPIWSNMDAATISGICLGVEKAYEFSGDIKAALELPRA